MRVTVVSNVVDVLGTVSKGVETGLEQLEDESRPFKRRRCWNLPEYWEKSWRPEETYCPSASS